jgi:protein SCO1/2
MIGPPLRAGALVGALLACGLLMPGTRLLAAPHPAAATQSPEARAHAAHHQAVGENQLKRAQLDYKLPDLRLVRDDGKAVTLSEALDVGHPVFVDFIYTTCTAICPVTSATFAALQEKLAASHEPVNLVSFSIDPEEDTPRRLTEFRRKYGAGPQWRHYTGTVEASIATQRAFGVFTGDKMGHTPVTLFRAAPGQQWVRLDGFATPDELLREYRGAIAGK